jgi:alpha-D-glucose phosphate-specific phosphoglucomutase
MKAKIKFGTDGWRAVIADEFTFENLERVAQATASYWLANPVEGTKKQVVVGYDRRFLSDAFAERTAGILCANGFKVILSDAPTLTQAVSFAVHQTGSVGGVMITASHNPPVFNGFKIKAHYGGSAEPAICQGIEKMVDKAPVSRISLAEARSARLLQTRDLKPMLFKAQKKLVDFDLIAESGLRFAHDPLFGVGAGCFEELLAGTTCQVTTLNAVHDPNFGGINPEPIRQNYGPTSDYLRSHPHDVCLVTDGDADRVGGMDGRGEYITTHQIISMLLRHMHRNRGQSGRVIKALTTTSMVDRICEDFGLELMETGVGFKYVAAEMMKGDVLLGAEESGGIGFAGHIPERDGILAGLMLLEMLAMEKKSIKQILGALTRRYGPHCYDRIDGHFPLEKRQALMDHCASNPPAKLAGSPVEQVKTFDGVKMIAKNGAWLMLRGSGTEPVLRIYAEAPSDKDVASILKAGQALTRQVS